MAEARILVVDDDLVIRETLAEALADAGYEPRTADDGRAALAVLAEWPADLILLDLMMPGMDGLTFRAEQRRRPELRAVPVVILSASRRLWLDAATLAPAAVVEKPFSLDALLTTIAGLVRQPVGAAVGPT